MRKSSNVLLLLWRFSPSIINNAGEGDDEDDDVVEDVEEVEADEKAKEAEEQEEDEDDVGRGAVDLVCMGWRGGSEREILAQM